MYHALLKLAQAAHVRAVAHASGSDGGLQADPPLVTSRATLTYGTGLPSGPCRGVCDPSSSYHLIDGLRVAHLRPLALPYPAVCRILSSHG